MGATVSGAVGLEELRVVAYDHPAAVLLVDTEAGLVVYADDVADRLAPGLEYPVAVEEWSRAAQLRAYPAGPTGDRTTPLAWLQAGGPGSGRQVAVGPHPPAGVAQEPTWAVGAPLHDAPEPLQALSLLVLLPVRPLEEGAAVEAPAPAGQATQSVLVGSLAMAISDATLDDDPLVWVSRSFEHLTGFTSAEAVGRNCRFLQGPSTDPASVRQMRAGIAADEPVSLTVLNYRRDGSAFYNHLVITPVFDTGGVLTHRVSVQTDVTAQVAARSSTATELGVARASAARARRSQAAAEGAGRSDRLLLTLSEALTATTTVEQIATAITDVVATELGAAGGGLLLSDAARTRLDFVSLQEMPGGTDRAWSSIRWDADAPLAAAARTRRPVFYPDTAAMLEAHPSITDQALVPEMGASASLPLLSGGQVLGAAFLYWDRAHLVLAHQQDVLTALARYTAQAVQRALLIAERRTAAQVLQQSLLTRLPEPDHLEVRARYVPAAAEENVGGDWYDAVILPGGATALMIGDVTGHDILAAAKMGQVRGLLRAYAYDREEPPSEVVSRLDHAVVGLHTDTLATVVLARVEQDAADAATGMRRLRWNNAGHPPPILLHTDGTTEVLWTEPETLVGLSVRPTRSDHTHPLPPSSTLLLYTDGLIEHRGRSIDDGITDLRRVLATHAGNSLEDLLDDVVAQLVGDSPDDDCAILAVRTHPEDRPRPAEAGASRS